MELFLPVAPGEFLTISGLFTNATDKKVWSCRQQAKFKKNIEKTITHK